MEAVRTEQQIRTLLAHYENDQCDASPTERTTAAAVIRWILQEPKEPTPGPQQPAAATNPPG